MKRLLMLLMVFLLLAACGNEEAASEDTDANKKDEELAKIEKENEELKRKKLEEENEELRKELEKNDEDKNSDVEKENETTENNSSSASDSDEKEDEDQTATSNMHPEAQNAAEDCVLKRLKDCADDFTEDELLTAYYDLTPRNAIVDVGTTAGITIDYIMESVKFHDENGSLPDTYDLMEVNEEQFARYEQLITEYLGRLTQYYNVEDDPMHDVFYYLREGSAAYEKIMANKASGNFDDHVTHDVILLDVSPQENGIIKLNVNRVYEHRTSNGRHIANVNYFMNEETFEIINYKANSNEPSNH